MPSVIYASFHQQLCSFLTVPSTVPCSFCLSVITLLGLDVRFAAESVLSKGVSHSETNRIRRGRHLSLECSVAHCLGEVERGGLGRV
jgi:hypothetical protein